MHFSHHPDIWNAYPELAAAVLFAQGIHAQAQVGAAVAGFEDTARSRLAGASEGEWPEVQAWRRAFSRMGLKPTQYRCASESLLRRFRKEGNLPQLHPLVDLCNAVSLAFGIPIAVFDVARIQGSLEVRHARGDETHEGFSGAIEQPQAGEVIFADEAHRAHARRWTHRQSGLSAVREDTAAVLIVAEAMHAAAQENVAGVAAALARELSTAWQSSPRSALLGPAQPRFAF